MDRATLIREIADEIIALRGFAVTRVAVDGVDGAGKTYFADELSSALTQRDCAVIRASVDDFHNPRAVRYCRGRTSPEGFFFDSYDYSTLSRLLLDPLSPGGSRRFRRAAFDHRIDEVIDSQEEFASEDAILVIDGIFLHRDELRGYWDYSVLLSVEFAVSIPRGALRGEGSADPAAESNRRYIEGQQLYFAACLPHERATVIVDNNDLLMPFRIKANKALDPSRLAVPQSGGLPKVDALRRVDQFRRWPRE